MENQATAAPKQSKGMKKLWLRFKASMKTDQPKSPRSSTTPTTSKPMTTTTQTPVAAKTLDQPASSQIPESSNITAQPIAQPESKAIAEDTKPASQPSMALDVIQVDDEDDGTDEKYVILTIIKFTC